MVTLEEAKRSDRGVCIRCFCCRESCPKAAMRWGRHAIMKLPGKYFYKLSFL